MCTSICVKQSNAGCQWTEVHAEIQLLQRLLSDVGRALLCLHCLTRGVGFWMQFLFHLWLVGLLQAEEVLGWTGDVNCTVSVVFPHSLDAGVAVFLGEHWHFPFQQSLSKWNQIMLKYYSNSSCKSNYRHANAHVFKMCANAHSLLYHLSLQFQAL